MSGIARGSRLARRIDPLDLGSVTEQARTIAPPVGLCAGSKMCVPEICRSSSAGPASLDLVQMMAPAAGAIDFASGFSA